MTKNRYQKEKRNFKLTLPQPPLLLFELEFDKISSFVFRRTRDVVSSVIRSFQLTLVQLGQIFIAVNGQILKTQSGHIGGHIGGQSEKSENILERFVVQT